MDRWTMKLPVPVEFGQGCVDRLGSYVDRYRRVLLVPGQAMGNCGVTNRVEGILASAGLECRVIDEIMPDPNQTDAEAAAEAARDLGADVVVGIGGGSAIDVAKAAALGATHPGPVLDYWLEGPRKVTAATLPVIAISSTSGTGSHIGRAAVISDSSRGVKLPIVSDYLYPRAAFCDPEILRTMPQEVTASSGFDAFTHALEGYLSSNENPMGNLCALEAIRIIPRVLPEVVANGDRLDLRAKMAWADTLAGVTLASNSIITAHSLAHVIGAKYGIPHGRSLACVTIACLAHSQHAAAGKLAEIGRAMGGNGALSDDALADYTIREIEHLVDRIGLRKSLADYGMPPQEIPAVVSETCSSYRLRLSMDPEVPDAAGLAAILEQSMT